MFFVFFSLSFFSFDVGFTWYDSVLADLSPLSYFIYSHRLFLLDCLTILLTLSDWLSCLFFSERVCPFSLPCICCIYCVMPLEAREEIACFHPGTPVLTEAIITLFVFVCHCTLKVHCFLGYIFSSLFFVLIKVTDAMFQTSLFTVACSS